MSIKVDPTELAAKAAAQGSGFLITADGTGGPHTMSAAFEFATDEHSTTASCGIGRTASRNINSNPFVTLLWPPAETGGHSLIADGEASVAVDGHTSITILSAVLHRPAE